MTYAVDSNVIIDILIDDPEFATPAINTLYQASRDGNLIACDIVWAEASSHIPRDRGFLRQWFSNLDIIDPSKQHG